MPTLWGYKVQLCLHMHQESLQCKLLLQTDLNSQVIQFPEQKWLSSFGILPKATEAPQGTMTSLCDFFCKKLSTLHTIWNLLSMANWYTTEFSDLFCENNLTVSEIKKKFEAMDTKQSQITHLFTIPSANESCQFRNKITPSI